MSGGVDSAVAAARLVDAGHDVVGVTLHLWDYPVSDGAKEHGRCCAPEDQYDARRTSDALGIAHFTFDRRELFARTVVEPFVDAYLAGETPSPCTACNRGVKIGELVALADRLGAAKIATGHYARLGRTEDGVPFLREGADGTKDQSYFLYATPREILERLVFPLGESTKAEVRAEAVARKIAGATKGESQELCFVGAGAGAYAAFVEARAEKTGRRERIRPGPIVDGDGRVVGQHEGIHRFTIGQRKGLGVALGKPAFVTAIEPETATVRLGEGDALGSRTALLDDVVLAPGVSLPLEARVRVRYRHEGASGRIVGSDENAGAARIEFDEPVRAVSRGQVAVFYGDAGRVLGGARIC
ncbi:MAG: tRNA 2-thiouridine(34) synthase MnmA [Deltaproteobacteria bacterium]|nr:tRNA 2-thiouridine(34) synthase MnmA [Deltaproteobacteria bacterium]